MKKFLNWIFLAIMAVVVLPLASCDSTDDYKVEFTTPTKDNVAGKWNENGVFKTIEKATIDNATNLTQYTTIELGTDGTATGTLADGTVVTGNWSFKGDAKIQLSLGDFSKECQVKFVGLITNQMSLTYATKGTMPDVTDDNGNVTPGATVDINVSVHYQKVEVTAE